MIAPGDTVAVTFSGCEPEVVPVTVRVRDYYGENVEDIELCGTMV